MGWVGENGGGQVGGGVGGKVERWGGSGGTTASNGLLHCIPRGVLRGGRHTGRESGTADLCPIDIALPQRGCPPPASSRAERPRRAWRRVVWQVPLRGRDVPPARSRRRRCHSKGIFATVMAGEAARGVGLLPRRRDARVQAAVAARGKTLVRCGFNIHTCEPGQRPRYPPHLSQHLPTPPPCSHSAPLNRQPSPRELRIGHGGEHRHGGARALAAPPRQLRHRPPVLPP